MGKNARNENFSVETKESELVMVEVKYSRFLGWIILSVPLKMDYPPGQYAK